MRRGRGAYVCVLWGGNRVLGFSNREGDWFFLGRFLFAIVGRVLSARNGDSGSRLSKLGRIV